MLFQLHSVELDGKMLMNGDQVAKCRGKLKKIAKNPSQDMQADGPRFEPDASETSLYRYTSLIGRGSKLGVLGRVSIEPLLQMTLGETLGYDRWKLSFISYY
jgi:hypothetical protein